MNTVGKKTVTITLRCSERNSMLGCSNSDTFIKLDLSEQLRRYRTGGYYHHVSKKNATAPPNVVNTSDTQYLSLETCIIMIFTRWYDQHCTRTVASGHTLK